MSKRQADQSELRETNKSVTYSHQDVNRYPEQEDDMGEFEGPLGEEAFEDDSSVEDIEETKDEDADGMEVDTNEDDEEAAKSALKVYMPGDPLEEGQVLEADSSVYVMLHNLNVNLPFLSFDVLRDSLGDERTNFPETAYIAAGTSAPGARNNEVLVLKMSKLHKTQSDPDDSDDDDPEDLDENPVLEHRAISHNGCVNRLRAMPQIEKGRLASTWSETGKVHIWDLGPHITSLDTPGVIPPRSPKPLITIHNHGRTEGFAMDWSSLDAGRLLTGDNDGHIYHTTLSGSSKSTTDSTSFREHKSSVEDLQWSPTEQNVFASCSSDGTVKIWDTRTKKKSAAGLHASNTDVNVISWNTKASYLMASGHDDGVFSVWDLRTMKSGGGATTTPVATFKWHKAPITSIEWHPTEESVLAVSGADDQLTLWDLSVEPDTEEEGQLTNAGLEVPPQLLFVHQGQTEIKELHWHKQIPGCVMSTSNSGFNVFKTISI